MSKFKPRTAEIAARIKRHVNVEMIQHRVKCRKIIIGYTCNFLFLKDVNESTSEKCPG